MLKEILPISLQKSKEIQALTQSFDTVLSEIFQKIPNTLIYSRIDELNEEVLDLLAWQFHIEGWELANSIEEKRNLVKKAIELHKYKGTKYALKKVLEALNLQGNIQEWFEYNGEPYKFKVDINLAYKSINTETVEKLRRLINEYKNERSWLDSLNIYLTSNLNQYQTTAVLSGHTTTIYPYTVKDIQITQQQYHAVGYQSVHTATIYPKQ